MVRIVQDEQDRGTLSSEDLRAGSFPQWTELEPSFLGTL